MEAKVERGCVFARKAVGLQLDNVSDPGHQISIAFAPDVASAVLAVLRAGPVVYGHALNISCTESCTYREYVAMTAAALQVQPKCDPSGECAAHG